MNISVNRCCNFRREREKERERDVIEKEAEKILKYKDISLEIQLREGRK